MSFNSFQINIKPSLSSSESGLATGSADYTPQDEFQPAKPTNRQYSNPKGSFNWDRNSGGYHLHWKSWGDMEEWIQHEQAAKTIEFVRKDIRKGDTLWTTKHTYVCSRNFSGGRSHYVRKFDRPRKVPTKRIGCGCRLIVKTYPGTNEVLGHYTDEHSHPVGSVNTRFTRLPKETREEIEKMLRLGVEPVKVLEHVQEGIFTEQNIDNLSQNVKREHFCTRADIRRVEKMIEEETIRLASTDGASLLKWIEVLQERGAYVKLKASNDPPPPGTGLEMDVFVLIIQTGYQRRCWRDHGQQFAGIDATHNTTHYKNVSLFTLLVRDPWGQGMPVAWMISSNATEETIRFFLSTVRSENPSVSPEIFMSDKDHAELNAIRHCYPEANSLLCWWHVLHAWQQHFNIKAYPELWETLKKWIRITDDAEFWSSWHQIKVQAPPSLIEYFERYWLTSDILKLWSAVFRTDRNIFQQGDTNMLLEAWHHLLKGDFLQGKRNRRLDHLIHILVDKAIPHFMRRHHRQHYGFEGGDLEVRERSRVQNLARLITPDAIFKSPDEPDIYFVNSQTTPGIRYRVDIDAYDCECINFSTIFFCKHICAVQDHFSESPISFNVSDLDIRCADTFLPQTDASAAESDEKTPIPSKSDPRDIESLVTKLSTTALRLFAGTKHAPSRYVLSSLHDHLDLLIAELDDNDTQPSLPLPQKEKVAPNQTSWAETSAVMIAPVKGKKRKIYTDPYAGGEQSGKKACPDARGP